MCIGPLIKKLAVQRSDAIAVLAPNRTPLSFARLDAHIETVISTLNELGIGREDRVVTVLPDGPDMATAFVAIAAGATCAPLNPALRAKEFEFYLTDLNAKALLIQTGTPSAARDIARAKGIPMIELIPNKEAGLFDLHGDKCFGLRQGGLATLNEVALVLHTSGTTARPKIVPLTQKNLCGSIHSHIQTLELSEDDRCLNVMPLFHIHGLVSVVLSSLMAGSSVVCLPGFDSLNFPKWIEMFSPTWYTASPTIHQGILDCLEQVPDPIKHYPFRFVRSAAAPLPITVIGALEQEFNVPVIEAYGMTEAAGQICSNPLPPKKPVPGSVGMAAGPQVAIINDEGNVMPPGYKGEVIIKGENVMEGYENATEENETAFINGWFRTGDLGELNADGYLFIKGRIKEIINRGGKKIAPREVDEALMEHSDVAEAFTFGVSHRTLGEDVVTVIVPKKASSASANEIREFAFIVLADYKVPSHIALVEQIPKSATGKPQRLHLLETLGESLQPVSELPRNNFEQQLAAIWIDILGITRVNIKDNYFMIGGDSLSASRVVNHIRSSFEVELPLRSIFERPILEDQAALIEKLLNDSTNNYAKNQDEV